jgi:STE24 endopeptidase
MPAIVDDGLNFLAMPSTSLIAHPAWVWTLVFAAALCVQVLLRLWLASRQIRHVALHRGQVPAAFASTLALAAHQKAADYTIARTRLSLLEMVLGAAVLLGWTLLGGLSWLNQSLVAWLGGASLMQQMALVLVFAVIGGLLDVPLSLVQTFGLEARFGFNKMTLRLWLVDALKGVVIGAVVGVPMVALVLWLMAAAGSLWWLWAWGLWMGFNLLMLVLYPTLIAPWFNQFKPLQDEVLAQRVGALMQRCGFAAKGLFVMDGSRRSAHANAYFTGFGAAKRVVFYDTLLARLSPDEVDAVLAHELGHFRHRHVQKRVVGLFALSLLGFALLGWVSGQAWFYTGLGVMPNMAGANDALALLLFAQVLPLLTFFVGPLMARLSRRHEFEADAFAAGQTSGSALASALLKLFEDNASTVTPDPLYAAFYHSHPVAAQRLARLQSPVSNSIAP